MNEVKKKLNLILDLLESHNEYGSLFIYSMQTISYLDTYLLKNKETSNRPIINDIINTIIEIRKDTHPKFADTYHELIPKMLEYKRELIRLQTQLN